MKENEFIIATHYFGDGSPINMWSTLNKHKLRAELKKIKSEGFNSIILLIPWSGFNLEIDKKILNGKYIKLLRLIQNICSDIDLGLILRIGYLWDSTPTKIPTYHRFVNIVTDREIMKAWLWFLKALYNEVKNYSCYKFSFISWEDFYWPIYRHYQNVKNIEELNTFMYESGLQKYFLELNSYIKHLNSASEIPLDRLPEEKSEYYSFYTNYYDNFILRKIVDLSCMAFPDLSVELRVDPEWTSFDNKNRNFHFWSQNYYKSSLPIVYYHSNIGRKHDVIMPTDDAVQHLKSLLDTYSSMRELGQNKPFVDQLNYFDDTYALWGKINPDDANIYAEKIFETLKKMSSGYAIWGYKDWRKNIVHNPFFYLGSEGWSFSEDVIFTKQSAIMKTGSFVFQDIPHLALDEGDRYLKIKGYVDEEDGNSIIDIEVTYNIGSKSKTLLDVNGNFSKQIVLNKKHRITGIKIVIKEGKVVFKEASIVGRIFSQGFASSDGTLTKIGKRLVELQCEYKGSK